jgi:hypothetical protein
MAWLNLKKNTEDPRRVGDATCLNPILGVVTEGDREIGDQIF